MGKIGIFAGTFDPVHDGHVAFALAALTSAGLERVIFLPERRPRGKRGVTSIEHRLAMLRAAAATEPRLEVMDIPHGQFTVAGTLAELKLRLPEARLALLVGTDVARHIHDWPGADILLNTTELIIGVRQGDHAPADLRATTICMPDHAHIAASQVRSGMSTNVAPAVAGYIQKFGLYEV